MPALPNAAPLAGLALRCQSDSRLVELAREGQTRAFEEIVRRYREPLVSFAGAIVPADRAEDVVQEALTKAHAALVASEAEVKLKPWLYTIVRNRALNDLRDEQSHEHLDESFDGVPQPPEVAASRAQVNDLPPAQRDALVQRELEGRSHREIGVALGVSPGAVRGLIFRARTALRDGTGMLIPMPALRALLDPGPLGAETTGTGIGGAAVGLTAGGGGGVAAKAGATLAIAVVAISSGAAVHNRGDNGNDSGATTFASKDHQGVGQGAGGQWGGDRSRSSGRSGDGSGSGSHGGLSPGRDSDDSGGAGDSSGRGQGGDDGSGDDDRSDGGGDDGHEGSGGAEEEHKDSVSEGSGSGSSGSGSGDSGSSGSGSSGSGSGGSGDGSSSGPDAETDADSSDEALSTDM
jgi:RNA polymerase sigma factor (sigma-70 family)